MLYIVIINITSGASVLILESIDRLGTTWDKSLTKVVLALEYILLYAYH